MEGLEQENSARENALDNARNISSEDDLIKERKEKIVKYFKTNYNWVVYAVLAFIVFLAVKIRTLNLPGLRDITTNDWTLGPDLDPFLFLRWAKYIVEHGSLFAVDTMRYVPLGFKTSGELLLHPYMIAWFHKLASLFGSESVTQSAAIYPAFMFALTVIAFFFMTREIFINRLGKKKSSIIGLIASFFLTVIPSLLPRTISGIPEKESAAFLFMFLAFYFYLKAWNSSKLKNQITIAFLAGASTAAMALIWGGYAFIFLTIAPTIFIAFLLGKVDRQKIYLHSMWVISALTLMYLFSTRYNLKTFFTSVNITPSILIILVFFVHEMIKSEKFGKYLERSRLSKIPSQIIAVILTVIILIILIIVFLGPSFISSQFTYIYESLVAPNTSRLILTVAENRQPFLTEWMSNYGPAVKGINLFFWLFMIGSTWIFYLTTSSFKKKERYILNLSFAFFLIAVTFSRYSGNSIFNGTNFISLAFYSLGFIAIIGSASYFYYKKFKEGNFNDLKKIDFGFILILILFFLSLIGARGSIRLILMLAPPGSVLASFLVVQSFSKAKSLTDSSVKIFAWILAGLFIFAGIFSGYQFYNQSKATAQSYIPSIYTQQWQKAMEWVRKNTQEDAVFGHWWDYGYWLQSIGERATILDGGNAASYWNHMMGRYVLTGTSNTEALEFLYAHNATHFLIDSTDIGKYSAFSSIGSDANYDRASYIPTLLKNEQATRETSNTTIHFYQGGASLDEDIIYELNETKIYLPGGKAGLGAVLLERGSNGELIKQPEGIFVYQNQQYALPFRYAYDSGEFIDFGLGIESGIFVYPSVTVLDGNAQIDLNGALLYLSKRTVKSHLARLYLYEEENSNFKLVHSEDDLFIAQVKSQNPQFFDYDFLHYQGLRGPIRIWEIEYPEGIRINDKYLGIEYLDEIEYAT